MIVIIGDKVAHTTNGLAYLLNIVADDNVRRKSIGAWLFWTPHFKIE